MITILIYFNQENHLKRPQNNSGITDFIHFQEVNPLILPVLVVAPL